GAAKRLSTFAGSAGDGGQSPFCVVFARMLSCHAVVGGAFALSATNAVQASFFDAASIRAEPLLKTPLPRLESMSIPTAAEVPKILVAPGARLSEVAAASLAGAPPPGKKTSTPPVTFVASRFVQEKNVATPPIPLITPGTVNTCWVKGAGSGLSTTPANADAPRTVQKAARARTGRVIF